MAVRGVMAALPLVGLRKLASPCSRGAANARACADAAAARGGRHASTTSGALTVRTAASDTLTQEDIDSFHETGCLVIPRFWSAETVAGLKERAEEMVRGFDASTVSVFSTQEQTRTSDDYFLESGDKVRFFFEEDAFDADGNLVRDKNLAINKIGHALHDRDDRFHAATYDPRVAAIARAFGYEHPLLTQTMYIFKQPGIGGVVTPHQDGTFLYTKPQSVLGFWWALEDCTTSNGCLWAVPGSHKGGVHRRFKRAAGGKGGTEFEPSEPVEFDVTGAQCLEVPAGTLVLLHSGLVHFSHANRSDVSRHAYTLHLVEGGKGVEYPADNWLQRPASDPFRTFPGWRAPEAAASATA